MPTYTVKKGDTMWALARRDLQNRFGRKPTNAEINRAVKNARVPGSGDKNKIKPGDKITFSYTAGGGSGRRGENSAPRASTKAERFRYSERRATKKTTAARKSAQTRRFREGERAATKKTSTTKKPVNRSAPAGSSASRWGKSQGAVQRGIRNTRANQQSRLDRRKASSDRAFAEQQARARAKMKKRYPGA